MGTKHFISRRYRLERSIIGDVMAAATKPTRMRSAPAIPESVSDRP